MPSLRRIIVGGPTNSGKSTLGAKLAQRLDVPFIELDALWWLPGWTERDLDEFRGLVRKAIDGRDGWVIAGNTRGSHRWQHSRQMDITWPVADTVVWLDFPLRITIPRILRRSWQRWRSNELLWGTNRERFWPQLKIWDPAESLVAFDVKWHREWRRRYEAAMAAPEWRHITFVRLRRPRELQAWLDGQTRTDRRS
jgi:adenylate kinase family enzyme